MEPQLPHGASSVLSGMSETFAFHSSPETFIASRILAFRAQHPDAVASRAIVRAKILNRDVAVVTSHADIKHILDTTQSQDEQGPSGKCPSFVAADAYKQFMAPFYPSPNVLLCDGDVHMRMRKPWEDRMKAMPGRVAGFARGAAVAHFRNSFGSEIDLYASLKTLAWQLLLGQFLELSEDDELFAELEKLQEDLLRGQFSLLPVSVNFGVWHSPRKRGIDSMKKIQELILQRVRSTLDACPLISASSSPDEIVDIANHLVLFTSSLAVKGLASLLMAYMLNAFTFERGGVSLYTEITGRGEEEDRVALLRSILMETERMSPPIVGIMRRCVDQTIIPATDEASPPTLIPKGWDTWLYFVGGGRDPAAFGKDWGRFVPERYLRSDVPESLAFSTGGKSCLGQGLIRELCIAVVGAMVDDGIKIEGEVDAIGVRAWLGWEENDEVDPGEWARDMKQLPTQRPVRPVMVKVLWDEKN